MTASSRPWYETAFGDHYPELYAHRDEAEATRCLDLLPRLAPLGAGPLLDLGCGQGRHAAELARRGHAVVGLDLSEALLRRARAAAPAVPLVRADMRRVPLGPASCSAVLSLFTAFGYFGDVAAHAPVAGEVARVLAAGGHWFLDYLDSERVARELAAGPVTRHREVGDMRVTETRRLADGPRRVIKTVDLRGPGGAAEAPTSLRYDEEVTLFTLTELDDLAAGAGLRRVAAAGSYAGGPLQPGHGDRWLLVYRRDTGDGSAT